MNKTVRINVATIGILGGLISMEHGLFEILQGNVSTGGIVIKAIGPNHKLWEEAGERALTLIPNFLTTGIIAVLLGIITILWSILYVHKRYGWLVLFLLTIASLLFGGGIAFFITGVLNSAVAAVINKPLKLWSRLIHEKLRPFISKSWIFIFSSSVLFGCIAVLLAIFGIPNLNSKTIIDITYIFAYSYLGLLVLSYIAAITKDSEKS